MTIEWQNITVNLGDLQPWPGNPRLSTKKQAERLLQSWADFGQVQTIAVSPSLKVLDGHQRLSALLTLHGKDYEVDARQSSRELSDVEQRALVLSLHAGATGQWNWDTLSNWDATFLQDFGLDDDYFKQLQADTSAMLSMFESEGEGETEGGDTEPQVDRAEELRQQWGVEPGQLWSLGEHRLICGDCTDPETVARVMGGERARLEFSDPPYEFETQGVGIRENSAHMDAIEKAGINKFNPLEIKLLARTSVFCCNKNLIPDYIELAKCNKKSWDLCFYKKENTPPNFGGHLMTDTEYLPVIGEQSPNSGMEKSAYSKAYIGGLDENHIVAWQKPVKLVEKFLRLFSKNGDLIIDRFTCTGTTIIACQNLSRRCRAIELDAGYVSVTLQRFFDHTGITPELISKST